jgi:DNA-binding CsgD family transcriptional regulator
VSRRSNESGEGSAPVLTPVDEAQAGDTLSRVTAHALRLVVAVVPASVAIFYSVTRRMQLSGVVFVTESPALARIPADWARHVSSSDFADPFAPRHVADGSATVVGVDQLGDRDVFARSVHGRFLAGHGLDDEVALYVRASGAIVGGIALMRKAGAPHFTSRDFMLLRRLQPLFQHVYVEAREPAHGSAGPEELIMSSLTPREAEVAQLVGTGSTNAEIAQALYMSLATVKTHLTQIYAKLGVRNRTQLAILLRPPQRSE